MQRQTVLPFVSAGYSMGGVFSPNDYSPSGRYVLFSQQVPATGWDIHVAEVHSSPPATRPYTQDSFHNQLGKFSPDERWVAYGSTLSGQYELYINRFPNRSRPIQVSSNGTSGEAFWAPDGRAVYYPGRDGALMQVRLFGDPDEPRLSSPERLFNTPGLRAFAVSPDGEGFLALQLIAEVAVEPYVLVLNWASLLE